MHDRDSNPAPSDFLSERKPTELGRPSSEVKRSDKRPSGPGFESLRLDFRAISGRPPALRRRLDCTCWTFFAGVSSHSGLREFTLVLPGSLDRLCSLQLVALC